MKKKENEIQNKEKVYYSEEIRAKIEELTKSPIEQMVAPTKASIWYLYDLLAMQLNELQRLNNAMESILSLISKEQ